MALVETVQQSTKWMAGKKQSESVTPLEMPPVFSRFSPTSDLVKNGVWISDRVREVWTHLNERTVLGWLRSSAESNENFFVKTSHAVSLFRAVHNALNPNPSVEEIFVFVDDRKNKQSIQEGAAHYAEARRWGRNMQATSMIVGNHSDVPMPMIRSVLGTIETSQVNVARLSG